MNMKTARLATLAIVAALCATASALVTEIPENGTLYVGGDATSGAPYNKQNAYIVFNPGSTLVVTQALARTVWATLIATNGAATLHFASGTTACNINSHAFIRGAGSLKVTGASTVYMGHAEFYPVLDIENLSIEDTSGAGLVLGYCTLLSLPKSTVNYKFADGNVARWLCGGPDMFPDSDEVLLDSGTWLIGSESIVPASKSIRVKSPAKVLLTKRVLPDTSEITNNYRQSIGFNFATTPATNYNNFILVPSASGVAPTLTFTNRAEFVHAGTLSGTGTVELVGYENAYSAEEPLKTRLSGDNSAFHGSIVLKKDNIHLALGHPHATGEATIVPAASGSTIYGTDGGNAKVDAGKDGIAVTLADAGTFELVSPDWAFTNHVAHWYDFSRVDTYRYPGEGSASPQPDATYNGDPLIERVLDWRSPDLTSLWNRRMYKTDGSFEFVNTVYPCRKTATFGGNSKSYLSLPTGNFRRIPISPGSGYNTRKAVPVQMAVMVFGSQLGGGKALLGTDNGSLGRTGTTIAAGITTNTRHRVWVDGAEVDPTAGNTLNGGWQIISMKLDGEPVDAVGWNNWIQDSTGGGQNYGELILFTEPTTERQRIEAEMYLAEKWGLSNQYVSGAGARHDWLVQMDHTNTVTVTGSVTVKAGEYALLMEGSCSGSVVLEGGTLLSRTRPWTASEVPSEGRIYWLDADDRSTLSLRGDIEENPEMARTNEVYAVRDKGLPAYENGRPIAYGVSYRKPTWYKTSFNDGPLRGWLDFNQYYKQWPQTAGIVTDGNCLRFYEYSDDFVIRTGKLSSTGSAPGLATIDTRTAFVAQNSVRGGGTPLLDNLGNSGSIWQRRDGGPQQPLWRHGPAAFANGVNRLNGVAMDPTRGYTGKPEVFSVRGTDSVNLPFIEGYNHSEGAQYGATYESGKAAIIGEMLWYSTALDDDTMVGIESYLMKKWLNMVPSGFADISEVMVSGTGMVTVADAVCRPGLDSTFSGTFAVGGDMAFEMTADTDTGKVMGALDCPAATLSLPASCSITLDFTCKPTSSMPTRDYVLVDCASGASGVAWTLNRGANAPSRGIFLNTGNKIVFRYLHPGMSVSFR